MLMNLLKKMDQKKAKIFGIGLVSYLLLRLYLKGRKNKYLPSLVGK